ncbi:hypothetical protein A2U01_0093640, partial [Trifolium medium]|nr:hypothetical protein [Trifolium medium]
RKSDAISYNDVVSKPPGETSIDGGDVQVDDDTVTEDHVPNHEESVEEEHPEPAVEPELRRPSRER